MGLPQNTVIELGEHLCSECPHASQSSCFQPQKLRNPGQTIKKCPSMMLAQPNFTLGTVKSLFSGHPQNPDASTGLPD